MARKPNFLAAVTDYTCINISARAKQLKPATDLATPGQQRSLAYVLDVFPGLYCQRVTAEGSQPRATISKPVLIVSLGQILPEHQIQPLHSNMTMDGGPSNILHGSLRSHYTADSEHRVIKSIEAPSHRARRSHRAERPDYRLEDNLSTEAGLQTQPQSSPSGEDMNNPGRIRETRRQQPHHHSASQGGVSGLFKRYF
jgi:hypothetical protein